MIRFYVFGAILQCVHAQSLSHIQLFSTSWSAGLQAPLFMALSGQEYWGTFPFPPPRDLAHAWIKLASPVSPAWAGRFFTTEPPGKLAVT